MFKINLMALLFLCAISLTFADSSLENYIGGQFGALVGDPFLIGIVFLLFFFMFVIMQGVSIDVKIAVLIPAVILSFLFIPFLAVLFAIIVGFLIYLALKKAINQG